MNELVQNGFFDAELVRDEITIIANLEPLSKEDLLQEASAYHSTLELREQQFETIIQFAAQQKKSVIYEKGMLYKLMKERLSYDEWLDWLKENKTARSSANEYIQLATEYQIELSTASAAGSRLSKRQLLAAHRTGEGHEIIAKVEDGTIKPDAINTEIEAAKKRAKEAEEAEQKAHEEAKIARQQVFDMELQVVQVEKQRSAQELEAQRAVERLNEQIKLLNQQIAAIPEPEIEIREVEKIPDETVKELEDLRTRLDQAIYERDNEAARAETFAKKFREDLSAQKEDEQRERTRQRWHTITADFQNTVMRVFSQWPTTLDTQTFDFRDWVRLDQVEETANRLLQECKSLRQRNNTMIIDSES